MEGLQRNHHNCINWMNSNLEFQTEEQGVNPVCSSWTPSLDISPLTGALWGNWECVERKCQLSVGGYGEQRRALSPKEKLWASRGQMPGRWAEGRLLHILPTAKSLGCHSFTILLRHFHWTEHLERILIQLTFGGAG